MDGGEYRQLNLFDYLQQEPLVEDESQVDIEGALNVKKMPISEYKVRMAYGDLTLIIAVLHDEEKLIEKELGEGKHLPGYPQALWEYYKDKFKVLADKISEQIEYDYYAQKAKCEKKATQKQSSSDIGGDAMELAFKYGKAPEEKKDKEEVKQGEGVKANDGSDRVAEEVRGS